jgi:hypothetical protein
MDLLYLVEPIGRMELVEFFINIFQIHLLNYWEEKFDT